MTQGIVVTGLVPATSLRRAKWCHMNRDGRDKPGHDNQKGYRFLRFTFAIFSSTAQTAAVSLAPYPVFIALM